MKKISPDEPAGSQLSAETIDKTMEMHHTPESPAQALLMPEELLSARKAPNPLIVFLSEALETLSGAGDGNTMTFQEEVPEDEALPEEDAGEKRCQDPADNYELSERIAQGGQGYIQRAWDRQFLRTVAVKSLLPEKLHSPVRKSFFTEAKITAQLQHPAIVPIHCLWVDHEEHPHLAMKLVEGITLREKLDQLRKTYDLLPWRKIAALERVRLKERLEIFLKICYALDYAHSRHVIHRDLKPENVMLGRFGETYVLDWGLAASVPAERGLIESPICGTPRYIAPEVLNRLPYGKQADVYQLGLILYELVYLRRAYPLVETSAAMAAGREGNMAPKEHLYGCRTAPLLDRIIAKAAALRPEERYGSVRLLGKDVHAFLNQAPVSVDPHPRVSAVSRVIMRHSQKLLAVIAVLILLVFGLSSWHLAAVLQNERWMEQREGALRGVYATYLRNVLQVEWRFMEIDSMLRELASEAETRLETLRPPLPGVRFYDHRAGRRPETAPPGYRHAVSQGMLTSFEVPQYKIADTPIPDLQSYLATLYPMMKSCRNILQWNRLDMAGKQKTPDPAGSRTPIIAVYIGLQNGLFMTYPYTGSLPDDYDPRTRPWYQLALKAKGSEVQWSAPYVDQSVGRVVISGCVPVRDPQGRIIAVLALDLEPDTVMRAFMQRDLTGTHVQGRYLLNQDGWVIASDRDWQPAGERDQQHSFPYMHLFPELRRLKTGRLFVDPEETQLVIFHHIKSLNCYFAEIIDFERVMCPSESGGAARCSARPPAP